MFTDTHCHLSHIQERGEDLGALLGSMAERGYPFVLDIGTKPGDLDMRLEKIRAAGPLHQFLHFSCGLWPGSEVITDRNNALKTLEADLKKMTDLCAARFSADKTPQYAALGECGIDRFWNGPHALDGDPDAEDGPGTTDVYGEEELFGFQLDLARSRDLPVIVHSRDAFETTLGCVKNADWDRGVIHCFAYGIDEARAFLDRGWYISFPGNITWGKRESDRDRIARLVSYIPRGRLLLETDAPYLSPAPHRGKTNTPLLIEHTYAHAAEILGMRKEDLASLVSENASALFAYKSAVLNQGM